MASRHHTKDKGDIGLTKAIADLTEKRYGVCLPISEHMPFDMIALDAKMRTARVQSKYAKANKGSILLRLLSTWADGNGVHHKRVNLDLVDGYSIYCPETGKVYYVPRSVLEDHASTFSLRVQPTKDGSRRREADDFLDPQVLFAPEPDGREAVF